MYLGKSTSRVTYSVSWARAQAELLILFLDHIIQPKEIGEHLFSLSPHHTNKRERERERDRDRDRAREKGREREQQVVNSRGVVIGARDEDVTQRMPVQTPHHPFMGLLHPSHLTVAADTM